MAKLEIPIRVYMGELEEIINELKHLQTYKLFEGDDKVLINCDDVVEIFANHLRAEIFSGSTIEPERKTGKWLIKRFGADAQCSECGTYFSDAYDTDNSDAFCRHCGAKMDGLKLRRMNND